MLKTLYAAALGLCTALAQAATPHCDAEPQLKLERITERVILVGETHGNEQAPAFVARLICGLLGLNRPVILALERDGADQPALDHYLASAGTAADIRALLDRPEWNAALQDGRSSQATFKLLDQVRRWRQAGQPVELLMMRQLQWPAIADSAASAPKIDPKVLQAKLDLSMADGVTTALGKHPGYIAVVLAGTFHTVVGSKMHQDIVGSPSMGDQLAARMPVHAIGLSSGAGESWVCYQPTRCGPQRQLGGSWNLPDARIDTQVDLGPLTPSSPAALQPAMRE